MDEQRPELAPREAMEFDVVVVGAGPAGLAAAIRLKQLATAAGKDVSVVVLEKGSEVGAHIMSGAVIDPKGLNALIPDWQAKGAPLTTPVTEDRFLYLWPSGGVRLPNFLMPPLMSNHGNYIASLGQLVRWLGEQATELGVEIYPGFAAAEVLTDEAGAVAGVATGDMGVGRDGKPKETFVRGMELRGKYTLVAEGARGSLSKQLIKTFKLDADAEPQKYGIGLKELWEVAPGKHQPGLVQHSFGWPLDNRTGGGSFLYHYGDNKVAVGFVLHLNYENPYLDPFKEFQRVKTHAVIRDVFAGGKRIAYGARAITEGGWQSMPKLAFPGGALLGCAAGFMNVPRIKGSHNAIVSGIAAAEAAFAALGAGRAHDTLDAYEAAVRSGPIAKDLRRVRNAKPLWSRFGTALGIGLGGLDMWLNTILPGIGLGYTLRHRKTDAASLRQARNCKPIDYPKPDGVLTFDRLTSVSFSATNHEEDQPVHLKLEDPRVPKTSGRSLGRAGAALLPGRRLRGAGGRRRTALPDQRAELRPLQNLRHQGSEPEHHLGAPEGGGGPNYAEM